MLSFFIFFFSTVFKSVKILFYQGKNSLTTLFVGMNDQMKFYFLISFNFILKCDEWIMKICPMTFLFLVGFPSINNALIAISDLFVLFSVTLKNAVDVFQFACLYNANQLKSFTCDFISLNLSYFLDSRYVETYPDIRKTTLEESQIWNSFSVFLDIITYYTPVSYTHLTLPTICSV